jgi:biopolymer transport protein ExbD
VSGSRIARRQARNHRRYRGRNDLNIVPMLDVMVILVFFLIFTAVFSRTSILELSLPPPSSDAPPLPPQLELEIIVRGDSLQVADRSTGPLKTLPNLATGYDVAGLTEFLKQVKAKFPEKTDATVLMEPDVSYDTMVQVMDAVRTFEVEQAGQVVRGELFPQVAVGDAPT